MGNTGSTDGTDAEKAARWRTMYNEFAPSRFPTVRGVTVEELFVLQEKAAAAASSDDSTGDGLRSPPVLLVDCRSVTEQNVSMLPGAITQDALEERLSCAAAAKTEAQTAESGRTDQENGLVNQKPLLVCYCTIGYRSGLAAKSLQQKHPGQFAEVLNLEGSLLAWTHARSRPQLIDPAGHPTTRLHVYGKRWDLCGSGYQTEWHTLLGWTHRV
jgi:rhodanese-related sulfurtransferase